MRKKLLVLPVAVALGAGAYFARDWWSGPGGEQTAAALETEEVRLGPIEQTVNTDGRVEALLVVDVKSKASGTVTNVLVNEADRVRGPELATESISELLGISLHRAIPGQLLVELDPIDEQRNVDRTSALLDAELAKLARATAELARLEASLRADIRLAEAEKQAAGADIENSKAAVVAAEAQVEAGRQEVAGAGITHRDAEEKFARQQRLLAQRLTSAEEFETARNNVSRFQSDLRQAEANLANAEARVAQTRTTIDQAKVRLLTAEARLLKIREAEMLQIPSQQQDIALARSQVAVARVALADARRRLEETNIVAPIDGVVLKKSVDRGQIISSGTQNVGGGTSLLTIADVNRLFVMASVPEADIELVRPPENGRRQKVRITADALGTMELEGEVVYRVPQAVTENNVTTVKVRIEVTDKEKNRLLPGETCNVAILAASKSKALLVPASAVARGDGKDERFVWTLGPDGKPKRTDVKLGLTTATSAEVLSGLKAGDKVVKSAAAVDAPRKKGDGKSSFRPPRF